MLVTKTIQRTGDTDVKFSSPRRLARQPKNTRSPTRFEQSEAKELGVPTATPPKQARSKLSTTPPARPQAVLTTWAPLRIPPNKTALASDHNVNARSPPCSTAALAHKPSTISSVSWYSTQSGEARQARVPAQLIMAALGGIRDTTRFSFLTRTSNSVYSTNAEPLPAIWEGGDRRQAGAEMDG